MTACKARPAVQNSRAHRRDGRDKLAVMGLELRTVARRGDGRRSSGRSAPGSGMSSPGEDDEYSVHLLPAERCLAVHDDDAVVATAGAFPFRLTVPGGAPGRRGRGDRRDRAADAPAPRPAAPDDGRAARRRRAAGRAARRAHRIGGLDLRALRLRHRHVHDAVGSWRRSTPTPARPLAVPVRLVEGDARVRGGPRGVRRRGRDAHAARSSARPDWWSPIFNRGKRGVRFFTAVHDEPRRAPGRVRALRPRPVLARRRPGR